MKEDLFKNVRLIVSDVDGTLLDPRNQVAEGALSAVQQLRERGIQFTLASGRGFSTLKPLVDYLDISEPVIAAGGSMIVHPHTGALLREDCLSPAQVAQLVNTAREHNLGVIAFTGRGLLTEMDDPLWEHLQTLFHDRIPGNGAQRRFIRVKDILEEMVEDPFKVNLHGLRPGDHRLRARLSSIEPRVECCFIEHWVEITTGGATKGARLVELAQMLEIPLEQVMAIGDNVNDVSLFETAGVSVAMGNASDEVKSYADVIAPGNEEHGFTWALENLVLSN